MKNSVFGTELLRETMISGRQTEICHFEIENFSVSTDVKFLFDIGRI